MQVESTSTSNFQKGSTKLFPTSVIETATVIKELQRMKDGDQSLQVEIEKENHFMGGQLLVKVSAFIKALTEETNPIITEGKAHLIPNDMFDDDKMPKAICSLQDMSFQRAYRDGSAVITSATAENKIKKEESSVDWQEHQNKQTTEKHNFIKAGACSGSNEEERQNPIQCEVPPIPQTPQTPQSQTENSSTAENFNKASHSMTKATESLTKDELRKVSKLEEKIASQQEEIVKLKQKVESLEKSHTELKDQSAQQQQEIVKMKQQFESLRKSQNELKEQSSSQHET